MSPNAMRYDSGRRTGHVESWFLRANDPVRPRALWLKATILATPNGGDVAECWAVVFDGDTQRTFAHRETVPLNHAAFVPETKQRLGVRIGPAAFVFGAEGSARGELVRGDARAAWDLRWTKEDGAYAEPLSIYPYRAMVDGPFPKSKLLTPHPALRFEGRLDVFGESLDVAGWRGMQGHNWGREHAFEYAWGQVLFDDAMVEGFTGRIKVAGRTTPRMSALVVRRGNDEYRFDRVFDFWRQEALIEDRRWRLHLRGAAGEATLELDATDRPMACLGYRNPDGRLSYCLNSKLARAHLEVKPARGDAFSLQSEHGGALEFLRAAPDAALTEVV